MSCCRPRRSAAIRELFTRVVAVFALFTAAVRGDAITITKLSWESKPLYTRLVVEFDQHPRTNVVDQISGNGYFYIDIYGMTSNYRRRLLNVDDNTVRYIDARTYPEQSVLRLAFFVKDLGSSFHVSWTAEPERLIIDTIGGGLDRQRPLEIAVSSTTGVQTIAQSAPRFTPTPTTGAVASPATVIEPSRSLEADARFTQPVLQPAPYAAPRKKRRIVIIDPGHGGANAGATAADGALGRMQEKDLTLKFAAALKKVIDQSPDMISFVTRVDDSNISLQDRIQFAENQLGDIFISLHLNDGAGNPNARGVELFYLNEQGVEGAVKAVEQRENREIGEFATNNRGELPLVRSILSDMERRALDLWKYESAIVCNKLQASLQQLGFFRNNNRGIKEGNFVVLKNFKMPAILVEIGFITNAEDRKYLANPQFQQATAVLIYNALSRYFAENELGGRSGSMSLSSSR